MKILKSRLGLFLITDSLFVLSFVFQKLVFLIYNAHLSPNLSLTDCLNTIWAGLPMDFSMACYLTVIPTIVFIASVFTVKYLKKILAGYFIFTSILLALVSVPDLELYRYWGFRIDATIFTYIGSPSLALTSLPVWITIVFFIVWLVYIFGQYYVFEKCVIDFFPQTVSETKVKTTTALVLLTGLMFIPIRGGVTTSTMCPSRVYFSENLFLNHAATNPMFNLLYSLKLNTNFDTRYRFMETDLAHKTFNNLMYEPDSTQTQMVLNTNRPNIIFIMLESFGADIITPQIAPNLYKLTSEGVYFKNMYANSFRTDRGVVSVLGGYPAQPTMSILKYANKVPALSSIPKSLINNGYNASFLYGGDVDFAQMKLFFVSQKVTEITADKDFPVSQRLTKWGVPDNITFDKMYDNVQQETKQPDLKMFLTLSSHEPFDVPTTKLKHPYLNSVAYTDSCLGLFVDKMKQSPQWKNTLIVLVPDHDMRYPEQQEYYSPLRHNIFMLWIGGAVKQPRVIDKICSQTDIAASLLSQLNINRHEFTFSKNVLNPLSPNFAFYDFPDGFGFVADKGNVVYDNTTKKTLLSSGQQTDSLLLQGKAYLQCLFDDIQKK